MAMHTILTDKYCSHTHIKLHTITTAMHTIFHTHLTVMNTSSTNQLTAHTEAKQLSQSCTHQLKLTEGQIDLPAQAHTSTKKNTHAHSREGHIMFELTGGVNAELDRCWQAGVQCAGIL